MNQDVYRESGLTVTLPKGKSFRFESTTAYKGLSGSHLREMDFCWLNNQDKDLWLMEILDLRKKSMNSEAVTVIIEKTIDSMLMLLSIWCDTKHSRLFNPDLPTAFYTHDFDTGTIKIIFVIRVKFGNLDLITPVKDHIWNRLKGRLPLLDIDINDFIFIDYEHAIISPDLPISR